MLKILLADDHDLFAELVQLALARDGSIAVTTVRSFDEALAVLVGNPGFDLVLLDVKMPGMTGPAEVDRLRRQFQGLHVAIISGVANPAEVRSFLTAGACGFIPKTLPLTELVSAVTILVEGDTFLPKDLLASPTVQAALPDLLPDTAAKLPGLAADLTPRETEMLDQLAQGWSNKQIGRNLDISEATVKSHLMNLFRKLGARNRTDAVRIRHSISI